MAIGHFTVELNRKGKGPVYSSGDVISGHVSLHIIGSDLMTSQISLELQGIAYTQFQKVDVVRCLYFWDEKANHKYTGEEKILTCNQNLFGDGTSMKRLPVGGNTFPFTITLPQNLPNSKIGKHAFIEYFLQAHIKRPESNLAVSDIISSEKLVLRLETVVDLNNIPGICNARSDYHAIESLQFPGLFFPRSCQSVVVEACLEKLGFVAGENINLSIEICNHTNFTVKNISAAFIQACTLKGRYGKTERTHKQVHDLGKAIHRSLAPGELSKWPVVLQLPDQIPPTMNMASCNSIKLDYYIKINAKVNRCLSSDRLFGWKLKRDEIELHIPIIIGTLPIIRETSKTKSLLNDFMDGY